MSQPIVRPARQTDSTHLKGLQQHLSEPSPALLSAALEVLSAEPVGQPLPTDEMWRLLVTPDATDTPVGYLLVVDGTHRHIAELVVAPRFRRQKRATALLGSVCASSNRPVTVCVAVENEAARLLYEHCGFSRVAHSASQFESGDGLTLRYDPATSR